MTLKHMLCLAALGCLASCSLHGLDDIEDSFGGVDGNQEIVSKRVDVGVFDSVHSCGSVNVDIVMLPSSSETLREVRVTCDSNLMDYIEVHSDGSVLVIDEHENITPSGNCVVEVKTPRLTSLETSGSSDMTTTGRAVGLVAIKSTGSGDVSVADVETNLLEVVTSGSGDIVVAGSTTSIVLSSSGSGNVDSRGLDADTADARTTGSGNLRIQASASVKIRSTGSGDVDVWGIPVDRDVEVTGSGDIAFH